MSEQTDGMTPQEAMEYRLFKAVQAFAINPISYDEFKAKVLPVANSLRRMANWTEEDYERAGAGEGRG